MKILGKRVLIKRLSKIDKLKEKMDKVGLVIPEQKDNRLPVEKGEVIEIGLGFTPKEVPNLKGKTVIYNSWAGDEIELEDKKYILVHLDDILIIL